VFEAVRRPNGSRPVSNDSRTLVARGLQRVGLSRSAARCTPGRQNHSDFGCFCDQDRLAVCAFHGRALLRTTALDDERAALIDRSLTPNRPTAGFRELFLEGIKTANDDVRVRVCWLRVTTANGIVWCSAPRRGAAAAVNPATPEEGRFSRGGCAVQRSWADSGLGLRVVCRSGLLGIEGLAVRVRFDPDRRTQRTVLAAVHRRGR
jgi:hypothetical protein